MAKILVLSSMYPPHHFGGYELSCRDVVDRWRERGHEVTVLTGTARQHGVVDPHGERARGVLRDLHIAWRDGELHRPPLWRRRGIELANQAVLQDALAGTQPDVVSIWHMGSMSTGLLTTLAGTGLPLVYVVCDDWPTYAHRNDPWMRLFSRWPRLGRVVERVVGVPATLPDVGRSGTFCFISESTRDRCRRESPWTFPDSTVTYNGIDTESFPITRRAHGEWAWRLVSAGRLSPRKGLETVVRALPMLPPETTLEVLPTADTAYRVHLERVATELGLRDRVRFTMTTRALLARHYAAADVCVFAPEWEEPFGLVPLEAMACGTPVVATASGGSAEYLADGTNCLTFPKGDAAALAAAVRRLAADPALRDRITGNGSRTASELSADRLADVLEAWHLAAAQRFSRGRPVDRVLAPH